MPGADWSNKAVQQVTTRHCYGVCGDPHGAWQLASRGDNVLAVWDARRFDRPSLTLPQARAITKIQVRRATRESQGSRAIYRSLSLIVPPTVVPDAKEPDTVPAKRLDDAAAARLATSQQRQPNRTARGERKTCYLHPWLRSAKPVVQPSRAQAQAGAGAGAETEADEEQRGPGALERDVAPSAAPAATLASFHWHPAHEARLLAVAQTGGWPPSTPRVLLPCHREWRETTTG